MTESLFASLPCGCKASVCGTARRIEAEAFTCPKGHKQGAVISAQIVFDEVDENAECIRAILRRHSPLDPEVTAAGEALGALIYLARKERS